MTLRIFEKHPTADAYKVVASPHAIFTPYAVIAVDKRFTDAELAAEFQHSRLVSFVRHRRTQNNPTDTTLFDHYERGLEQEWTLERFATLPHYDEVTSR